SDEHQSPASEYRPMILPEGIGLSGIRKRNQEREITVSIKIKVTALGDMPRSGDIGHSTPACQKRLFSMYGNMHGIQSVRNSLLDLHVMAIAKNSLSLQGIPCTYCEHAQYTLYPLAQDCRGRNMEGELVIRCSDGTEACRFALDINKENESEGD
ncbi:MAG: hypothetical protein MJ175_11890, partial [Clostridia bacterium]|nr:hypothetical protein [Clostridia bacterium]